MQWPNSFQSGSLPPFYQCLRTESDCCVRETTNLDYHKHLMKANSLRRSSSNKYLNTRELRNSKNFPPPHYSKRLSDSVPVRDENNHHTDRENHIFKFSSSDDKSDTNTESCNISERSNHFKPRSIRI